ncbi:ROK family protein [Amycolatopsis sp. OK19-0408]|uniref:ROK family protein n=1 Tax=Amycolatopsis iheyensis TaxID=2945988 RepID=A0A9X2SQ12_9PSEU|nr:ROK family protein [Amycolatopsis iheyensis]MCR6488771.1 ROK family protein [Amycolatopsis iheyensis]
MTKTWLGVDFGGTKVALRAETEGGEVREHAFRWRGRGLESDLTQLAAEVTRFRRPVPAGFAGIGVAMPATVGADGLVTTWPNRPEWTGLDLRRTFRTVFGDAPLRWADDGELGALGEARELGCDDLLYVGVGTGVGGGLILGGRRWPGSFELGHVVTDADGPECRCGRRGCVQASASGPATLARASSLRGAPVDFDALRDGWRAGADWAVDAVDRTCHRLAVAITGVRELLAPGTVVVGGGFAGGLPGFVDSVARHVDALARPGVTAPVVRASPLGALSTVYGAVALARL